MCPQVGPANLFRTNGQGTLERTRLFLVRTASGRWTFSTAGPGELELAQNDAGRWVITEELFGQRLFRTAEGRVVATGGTERRLYLTRTSTGRLTFSSTGPVARELVLNEDDRWAPAEASTGQRLIEDRTHRLTAE